MPPERSLDVDTPWDLRLAELTLRDREQSKPPSFIDIAGREVGPGRPCFVIAEAGVNHDGDPEVARALIRAAKEAGADAVKFQTWITEELVAADAPLAEYQKAGAGAPPSQFELLKGLELSFDDFRRLRDYAEEVGILFLSTPDEERSADFLDSLGVPAFKIGSAELTNAPFLRHVAAKGRPILLSTGMATLEEVAAAVRGIEEAGNRRLVLLHCVSCYPAEPADCNLRAMDTLATAFGHPVGFSDHTLGIDVALAAVARGACVLEKHFTLDKSSPGPDHRASLDAGELTALVRAVRTVEAALGDGEKRPAPAELPIRRVVRKSVVAARDLRAGERLATADLALRRTEAGLGPDALPSLVGRRLLHDVAAGRPLNAGDLG